MLSEKGKDKKRRQKVYQKKRNQKNTKKQRYMYTDNMVIIENSTLWLLLLTGTYIIRAHLPSA